MELLSKDRKNLLILNETIEIIDEPRSEEWIFTECRTEDFLRFGYYKNDDQMYDKDEL